MSLIAIVAAVILMTGTQGCYTQFSSAREEVVYEDQSSEREAPADAEDGEAEQGEYVEQVAQPQSDYGQDWSCQMRFGMDYYYPSTYWPSVGFTVAYNDPWYGWNDPWYSYGYPYYGYGISPDFLVLANGASSSLTSTLPGTSLLARSPAILSVSGLQVTGQSVGVTDVIGTNGGNTDSSRVAVTALDGFAVILTAAQNVGFNTVAAGATIGLDLWLLKPAGGSQTFGSISGTINWDPTKFQFVSFTTSGSALGDGWIVSCASAGQPCAPSPPNAIPAGLSHTVASPNQRIPSMIHSCGFIAGFLKKYG